MKEKKSFYKYYYSAWADRFVTISNNIPILSSLDSLQSS
jgi:hypothetical protein